MNYKDSKNKEQLRKFKNASITKLDAIITTGIDSEDTNKYKKSALITYWINDFSNYLNWESSFDPKRLKRYERGDVIKVNFGFNIGSEQGGMHYAIVIDAKNAINNGTITVIPLSSKKNKKPIHPSDVDLQDDLYAKLKIKCNDKKKYIEEELVNTLQILDVLKNIDESKDVNNKELTELLNNCKAKISVLKKEKNSVDKINAEFAHMKKGSVALVSQIRTVSKMRIYDPRTVQGVLSGVKLSPHNLDLISNKLRELFYL